MGGGRPVTLGVSFLSSSPILSSVSISPELSGVKKFYVGIEVTGCVFSGLLSPVMFLFFRFLSWNPSDSLAEASEDRGLFVCGVSVSLPTLFWSTAFKAASARQ